MKDIPSEVTVGAMHYRVLYPYNFDDDPEVSTGLHEAGENTIKISEYDEGVIRHPHKIMETFIHELVHAVDFVYCGYIMSERFVSVFSRGLTGVLLNNTLKLNVQDKKIPKKVKIGGYSYDVLYPHEFNDTTGFMTSSLSNTLLKMRISAGRDFDPTFIKANLMYCVCVGIYSVYFYGGNGDDEDVNWKSFSHGLYQVIVDNDIEQLVADWRVK